MTLNNHFIKLVGFSLLMAVLAVLVVVGLGTQAGSAHRDSASEHIKVLEQQLGQASQQELKTGQLSNTKQGSVLTGDSAKKMDNLHQQTQQQIDSIIARPENKRQGAIAAIRAFAKDPAAHVDYQQTLKIPYPGGSATAEVYYVGLDQYTILPANNKVVQVGERPRLGNEPGKQYDVTPRYDQAQLEAMAVAFIKEHAPDVDLTKLNAQFGSKGAVAPNDKGGQNAGTPHDTNYFFRWEGYSANLTGGPDEVPFIQVGFTVGGTFLSYTNSLTR
ncbi:MAG: hypothetical protein DLM69_04805 [Candidatus Chloroheliales bacterium]|nr:MAG: hypothetical protein DLM69_04805 [Chloroflexota bacterium]